ncbi:hypothetical protein R3P38DRAFT_3616742 [Favolaschia claudopus]|uniref:Uncharacterized protein n=1 Tax=Favolaschia claudopus TaxID=2862362 RepID=A0AAW0A2W4_9AGAR
MAQVFGKQCIAPMSTGPEFVQNSSINRLSKILRQAQIAETISLEGLEARSRWAALVLSLSRSLPAQARINFLPRPPSTLHRRILWAHWCNKKLSIRWDCEFKAGVVRIPFEMRTKTTDRPVTEEGVPPKTGCPHLCHRLIRLQPLVLRRAWPAHIARLPHVDLPYIHHRWQRVGRQQWHPQLPPTPPPPPPRPTRPIRRQKGILPSISPSIQSDRPPLPPPPPQPTAAPSLDARARASASKRAILPSRCTQCQVIERTTNKTRRSSRRRQNEAARVMKGSRGGRGTTSPALARSAGGRCGKDANGGDSRRVISVKYPRATSPWARAQRSLAVHIPLPNTSTSSRTTTAAAKVDSNIHQERCIPSQHARPTYEDHGVQGRSSPVNGAAARDGHIGR